jgi:hypothetical protein
MDDNQRKTIAKITSHRGKYFLEIDGGKKTSTDHLESVVAHSKQIVEAAKKYLSE